jgi:hypothetical protein
MLLSHMRCCRTLLKAFPKVYFDLKAFRRGRKEKKESIIQAEERVINRVYALEPPEGWTIGTFLEKANILEGEANESVRNQLEACFDDWSDFISASRKDLFRVSHIISSEQVNRLATSIELFNRGLFGLAPDDVRKVFAGDPVANAGKAWAAEDDDKLLFLAVDKYDYTFGDVWLYVSSEMQRPIDEVRDRFIEIYLKHQERKESEIVLTKSFRPLLMNRQFRLLPPQCFLIPSASRVQCESVSEPRIPEAFRNYRNEKAFL